MGSIVGDVMDFLGGGGDSKAQGINEQMLAEARALPLPILKQYYPELYKQVVSLNPELETAVNLGPSAMAGISTDPSLRQAQLSALRKLQGIGDANGMDAQFMADAARVESDVNSNLQGQQGAIMQNLATRGLSGGGSELVARNLAAQGAANRHSQSALDLKAQAEKRALEAIMNGGQLGGQIQAQDFSQQSAKAQAADAISRFNAQNQQNVNSNNVGYKNNAQQINAQNQQSIANQNTGLRNDAQLKNNSLSQQEYENELRKRGLITGAQQNLAQSYANEAAGNRQFVGGIISSGAQYAAGKPK